MAEALRQRKPKNDGFTDAELKRYLDYIGALGSVQVYGCILCRAEAEVAHVKFGEPCEMCGGGAGREVTNSTDPSWNGWWQCMACDGTGWRYGKLDVLRQDRWALPLCPNHHRNTVEAQHSHNEKLWWQEKGVDALALCKALQDVYNASKSRADALQAGLAVLEGVR